MPHAPTKVCFGDLPAHYRMTNVEREAAAPDAAFILDFPPT
jgi:hypothetical protein